MAQARPVVATAVGGTPELVVDGETGLLVPPGDSAALAGAISGLLSDRELASRLGEAGRLRAERRFDPERMARRVLEVYEDVVRKMAA